MNTMNYAMDLTAATRNNLAALAENKGADRFANLAAIGEATPAAIAFARQLNAVADFFVALRVGTEAQFTYSL